MKSKLIYIQTLSSLHCGTGQSIGAVDLPIAREPSTALPLIPGSGFKGALRGHARDLEMNSVEEHALFGPPSDGEREHAGGLSFGDGRLLFLPVRSLRGTFAWVTSPLLLSRLEQDCMVTGLSCPPLPSIDRVTRDVDAALVSEETSLILGGAQGMNSKVYFEDLDLTAQSDSALDALADWFSAQLFVNQPSWRKMFKKRLCVVSDDLLIFFARNAMEITTRVALEHETKTVKQGQLWTEEALPSESILVSLCTPTAGRKASLDDQSKLWSGLEGLTQGLIQIGGNATVGQGRCRLVMSGELS